MGTRYALEKVLGIIRLFLLEVFGSRDPDPNIKREKNVLEVGKSKTIW